MNRPIDDLLKSEHVVCMFHSLDVKSVFPTGIWASRKKAEAWIKKLNAADALSAYTPDESAHDSNVRLGHLKLTKPEPGTIEFQRKFTTAVDHHHYERAKPELPYCPVPNA